MIEYSENSNVSYNRSFNGYCRLCKKREARNRTRIPISSKVTSFVVVAATITSKYLMVPTCRECDKEITKIIRLKGLANILLVLCVIYSVGGIFPLLDEIAKTKSIETKLLVFTILAIIGSFVSTYYYLKMRKKFFKCLSIVK